MGDVHVTPPKVGDLVDPWNEDIYVWNSPFFREAREQLDERRDIPPFDDRRIRVPDIEKYETWDAETSEAPCEVEYHVSKGFDGTFTFWAHDWHPGLIGKRWNAEDIFVYHFGCVPYHNLVARVIRVDEDENIMLCEPNDPRFLTCWRQVEGQSTICLHDIMVREIDAIEVCTIPTFSRTG